jgi:hypothetical protein
MPWFGKSKKKEDDDISQQPQRNPPSRIERLLEPPRPNKESWDERKRHTRVKASKEGQRERRHSPPPRLLRYNSDSDEAPKRQPALNLLKTSGERAQRSRDEREPIARTEHLFSKAQRLGDEHGPLLPTRTLQRQPLGQSQKTRIVVGIDFGTTCVAWLTRRHERLADT